VSYSDKSNSSYRIKSSTTTKESKKEILFDRKINSGKPLGGKTPYISTQLVKCWSCSEIPQDDYKACGYILYKSSRLVSICRYNNHKFYPISFHDNVRCMLCRVDNLDPNDLGVHYHHPLTGQTDWNRDYRDFGY